MSISSKERYYDPRIHKISNNNVFTKRNFKFTEGLFCISNKKIIRNVNTTKLYSVEEIKIKLEETTKTLYIYLVYYNERGEEINNFSELEYFLKVTLPPILSEEKSKEYPNNAYIHSLYEKHKVTYSERVYCKVFKWVNMYDTPSVTFMGVTLQNEKIRSRVDDEDYLRFTKP